MKANLEVNFDRKTEEINHYKNILFKSTDPENGINQTLADFATDKISQLERNDDIYHD